MSDSEELGASLHFSSDSPGTPAIGAVVDAGSGGGRRRDYVPYVNTKLKTIKLKLLINRIKIWLIGSMPHGVTTTI